MRVVEEVRMLPLVPLPASEEGSIVEHVDGPGVEGPVVTLAGVARLARHLHETVVERQVVSDGVLPGGELCLVVREPVDDKVTDLAERDALLGRL